MHLRQAQSNPRQLLAEFLRYTDLIRREKVRNELTSEREILIGQLETFCRQMNEELVTYLKSAKNTPTGKNMSSTMKTIIWITQGENTLHEINKNTEFFLSDVAGHKRFHSTLENCLADFKRSKGDFFQDWCETTFNNISDRASNISLETNGKLMELNHKDGKLDVLYGDKLITLLREVKQLQSYGFKIPQKIEECAKVGQKFQKHAMILKQLAHFYNSIDKQMLPCQQSLMLESALQFEKLIKNPKGSKGNNGQITWDNPDDLERYTLNLQAAAEKLSTENRKLRKLHQKISEIVVTLISTDLLRQQQKWKDNLYEIRQIISEAVQMGFSENNMKPWLAHWDRQLYKVLEYQYQLGLDTLNENMSEIKVELTFRQKIQFRPPIEEIKAKYYREMKRFISIPNHFRGVNETKRNLIFQTIIERNAPGLMTCFLRSQELFKVLMSVQDMFKEYVVLGQVDIEDLVEKNLRDVTDWEKNFRALKIRGRDAEKLPK